MLLLVGAALSWTTLSAPIMATRIDVTVEDPADAEVVFAAFRHVEATANEWRAESPLGRVNAGAGGPAVAVPDDLAALIQKGIDLGQLTGGAFDISWAALWGLWDFDHPALPDATAVAASAAHVDYRRVELRDGAVRLPDTEMRLGLGGIAKGWALDVAAAALRQRGRSDFLLSAGGQVYAAGLRDGRPWRVGIRDPRGGADESFAVVEVSDASVSTSGDYERFFELNGVRYHHILNPKTGWPARDLRSVTVICADATVADGLSTALFVLGPERGLALAERLEGVEGVTVDASGRVGMTAGAPLVSLRRPGG